MRLELPLPLNPLLLPYELLRPNVLRPELKEELRLDEPPKLAFCPFVPSAGSKKSSIELFQISIFQLAHSITLFKKSNFSPKIKF